MFGFLFGWRKASKCKRVLKQLQRRLNLLKNKKHVISSHLRHDIVQLLRIGERNRALRRAHDLFLDESLVSLYHSLLQFSDVILQNLSYIRRHREVSDGVYEAVSTLIFASARCGDLPELRKLRALFGERYGKPFVSTALHLLPGNRVNPQIVENLSRISVSDDAKSNLLAEIAAEFGLPLQVLALEYTPKVHKQVTSAQPRLFQEDESEAEVYKFTLTDADLEEKQEESGNKASRDQRKVCVENDCIEERVVGKDQRIFRFMESKEETRDKKRSRRRSRTASSSPMAKDVECWRYYNIGNRRRQRKKSGQCYHIVYNVFTMWHDQKEKGQGERGIKEAKHVHPKLPDYDQIAAHFTSLRNQHQQKVP
ncbi:Regulator of Vps4 activity in the MVB pathway protein [Raphanus sativus]|nr:Regulator of Vps4 activity in the MVB pathway protein [Raphanus sativus]